MSESTSLEQSLRDFARGARNELAAALLSKYGASLIALATSRLSARLGRRIDAEDVTQSVYRTFFRRLSAGEFQLDEWHDLWRLLYVLTVRRICREAEQANTQKRNQARELDLEASAEVLSKEPSPEHALLFEEVIDGLLAALPEEDRSIVEARLAGLTHEEIKSEQGVSLATIGRKLRQVRARLEHLNAAAD